MIDKDLLKELENTDEYKTWLESLFAIIEFASHENIDDDDLIMKLKTEHLNTSFQLQKGLEKAKYNAKIKAANKFHEDWLLDGSGQ